VVVAGNAPGNAPVRASGSGSARPALAARRHARTASTGSKAAHNAGIITGKQSSQLRQCAQARGKGKKDSIQVSENM